ncbi:MAG: glycosyl hydrolase, partial [Flavobacteriaceae bacterium]|nr:glycosyl hydrolase [Flavobacteriaceae bacterium]
VGRIGLAIYDDNVVYAIHDSQFRREKDKDEKTKDGLQKDDFKSISVSDFLSLEDTSLKTFLKSNGFPKKYTVTSVKEMVKNGEAKPIDIAKYLENANSLLFDTPVVGTEVYKSTDGGKNWKKTHEGYLDNIYYSYGYYFGKIHVDPSNQDGIYIYGVPILKSKDGGKTFESIDAGNVHADHHALWINPKQPGHLINGNDGGVNITYDDGEHWIKNNSLSVGQFYAINVDNEEPYNVYGGLQDNGVWVGPHNTEENSRWLQNGDYPYKFIMGGDGMQIQIDNRNSNIVYTGYQFGNYYRLNRETDEQTYIQPKHELGENPYRFNWQTPILLSQHNQDILYLGGNKLMRSMDQGSTWDAISDDLTKGGKPGNVAYGTLTTMSESSFQFGLMYAGSDDGYVHVTKNGGGNWQRISNSFPQDLWVSRVEASSFKKERVYVTLNGYRWDDFTPYVFVSENYGATWKNISSNLPTSSVNVIKEDSENENVLYLGTDNGVYVSLNRGESWEAFSSGLTNVATHDLVVHPEAKDLVVGTHGRSIYIADISLLQKMNTENKAEVLVSEIESIRSSSYWGKKFSSWGEIYEPTAEINFYSPTDGKATISIQTEDGDELESIKVDAQKGVNVFEYHLTFSKNKELKAKKAENDAYYLPKGDYFIDVSINKKHSKTKLKVK